MKRDLFIDYAKGLATLSVIFIHTVFWSGQFYVPTEIRILSLLIDVPLFYALSGITSGGNVDKTLMRLLKLQITYMLFVGLLFVADYLIKVAGLSFLGESAFKDMFQLFGEKYIPRSLSYFPQWENLGNWWVHSYTNADSFPVVMGSFWYLKVYFILTVFGVLVLRFFPRHVEWIIAVCLCLTAIYALFPWLYPSGQVGYVALYLGIFLLGNRIKGRKLSKNWGAVLAAAAILSLGLLFYTKGPDYFYLINKQKFPPRLPYALWIIPSLLILFYLYNRVKISKASVVTFIGQNAIFFYFAQGISSSLIYFMVVPLKEILPWPVLLILAFVVNALLAYLIALLLKRYDSWGWSVLYRIKKATARKIPQ